MKKSQKNLTKNHRSKSQKKSEEKKKNKSFIILVILILVLLCGTILFVIMKDRRNDENNHIHIVDDIDIEIEIDKDEEEIEWEEDVVIVNPEEPKSDENVEDNKSEVSQKPSGGSSSSNTTTTQKPSPEKEEPQITKITKGGTYSFSGKIANGYIIVNTTDDVKIILDNVTLTNPNGPAIIVENANNVIIELADGSVNKLTDGSTYTNPEYEGCIFSNDDLIFQGNGKLTVIGNYKDGIATDDDLKIKSGTYIVKSADDSLRGNDSVYIESGTFTLTSGGDGIKSVNADDLSKGYVAIESGKFTINSESDGIQSSTKILITTGTFNIKTTGIISNVAGNSSKGLKASDNIVIENGTFTFNTTDDSIHSNNYVGIKRGTFVISSKDDGIHADTEILIDGGKITINNSYEGIESGDVTINGGNISITSKDDGINISGGNDSESSRPGTDNYNTFTGKLIVNSGTLYINAEGDGIDSNGSIIIKGGTVKVDGTVRRGNTAVDYDKEFKITGGNLIAVGPNDSHQIQNVSNSTTQASILFLLNDSVKGKVELKDLSGNIIYSYSPSKTFSTVLISNNKIKTGDTYTLVIDGKEYENVTISEPISKLTVTEKVFVEESEEETVVE